MRIDADEAARRLDELVDRVMAGEDVIITREGRPVARLVRNSGVGHVRQPGRWAGQVWISPDFDETPEWLIDAFEGK